MKVWLCYLGGFLAVAAAETHLLTVSEDPESMILGKWRETAWEYENKMGDEVNTRLGKTLVIHKAEHWEFLPGQTLLLHGKKNTAAVKWRLTGRGNVLRLDYGLGVVEHYNVGGLSPKTLLLNFETNIQAKGIAKLMFRKAEDL